MNSALSTFQYVFVDNKSHKTLFLLHGTGGDREEFLFLDNLLEKKYNLVGLTGNINEQGMNRFFKRHAEGVFDQENIKEESAKLAKFIEAWMKTHNQAATDLYFLGYSNGANILLATLFYHPHLIRNLLLLHPMIPFVPKEKLDLIDHKIFISSGKHDSMVPPQEQKKLIELLRVYGADLTIKEYESGHGIIQQEIRDVTLFLSS